MKKRIISLLLAVCILASLFAGVTPSAAAVQRSAASLPGEDVAYTNYTSGVKGSDFTNDSALAAKLDKIFNGTVQLFTNTTATFALGKSLDNSKSYQVAKAITGYQCYIYAQGVYYYLTGDIPFHGSGLSSKYFQHSKVLKTFKGASSVSYDAFKNAGVGTGAYIRTTNQSDGTYNGNNGHSMIVLSYNKSNIWLVHGNANGKGLVCVTKATWSQFNSSFLTSAGRKISHIIQPIATMTETYKLQCQNNYSGKNYLWGTDFIYPLEKNPDILYSRDESVTKVSIDEANTHNGYNSLKIVNTAAGASGKDLAITTMTNNRDASGWIADNKAMTLSFWAKASNAGTKIYFRWGYQEEYRSVTLTQDWAYYTLSMNKVLSYGADIHPYVDRAGTVWLAELQLEDGAQATAFVPENIKITYETVDAKEGQKYQLPADPVREGYTFDGWYTAKAGGEKITSSTAVKNGNMKVYAHWIPDTPPTEPTEAPTEPTEAPTEPAETAIPGDVDGSGEVDTIDAIRLAKYLVELVDLTADQKKAADVTGDGDVTTTDAIRLAKYLVGMIESLKAVSFNEAVRAPESVMLSVGDVTGKPGDTVTVPVLISSNPGFAGFTLTVTAPDGLTLKEIKKGAMLSAAEGMFTANVAKNSVNWTASANIDGDGELLLLTFEIGAGASGKNAVSLALKDGKATNFANADEKPVAVEFVDGSVTVEGAEPAGVKIAAGAATGKAGETVKVPVSISGNPGFAGFTLTVSAAEGLTLKSIDKGAKLSAAEGMFTANVAKSSVNWTGSANVEGDGEILLLTFEIGANAADGDYAVSLALKGGKATNFANADEKPVAVSFVDGAVKVGGEAPTEPTEAPTEPTEADKPCDGGKDCPSYLFRDVRYGDWYHEAVDFAVERGLFNGMTPTSFEPNTAMSRAMLVTVLWRYEGSPLEGKSTFSDVKANQWYTNAVAWAAYNDIVNGVGNNKFDPNGKITREQMAAILYRYSDSKGYDITVRGNYFDFPDATKVSSWASYSYAWAVSNGLITGNVIGGKTLLDPQGSATRAQVATILMRYIKNLANPMPTEPTEAPTEPTEAPAETLPDFSVKTITGETYTLSEELKTHDLVLINLFATWCGPCKMEFPYMQEAWTQSKDRVSVIALSIDTSDTDAELIEFANGLGLTLPMGNAAGTGLSAYETGYVPTTLLVDHSGRIVATEIGAKTTTQEFLDLFAKYLPKECEHEWEPATCFAPKTCAKCGATEGTKLAHDVDGYMCTRCGHHIIDGKAVIFNISQNYGPGGGCGLGFFEDGTYKPIAGGSTIHVVDGSIPSEFNFDRDSQSISQGTWERSGSSIVCTDEKSGKVTFPAPDYTW